MSDPYRWMSTEDIEAHGREWCSLPMIQPGPSDTPVGHPEHPDTEPEPELDGLDYSEWWGAALCAALLATGMLLPYLLGWGRM